MTTETKNKIVEIDGKKGEYTGFSSTTMCHHFSMYDGSTKKLSELEAIKLFGIDFVNTGKEVFFKVVKIGRKSGRRQILERNLTESEAQRVVKRYPNSSRSMVVYTRQ